MKRLYGAVPLSVLMLILAIALPAQGEGKAPSTSAAGAITQAPAASVPASASATSAASTSASANADAPISASATTAASSPASTAPASASTSASASGMAASAASTVPPPAIQASSAPAASASVSPLNWKTGPREIALLDQATIKITQDYAYLEQDDARQFLRKLGNPNADDVTGLFAGPGGNWLLVVRFNKSGYIQDDEELDWQLDELLDTLKKKVEQTNAIRKKNGVSETEIIGWIEKPGYDAKKHRLVWAVSARDKGAKETDFQSVNYNMYTLGKEGYFSFNLVTDLAQLEQNKKYASTLVSSVVFKDGKKYRDFKAGKDKVSVTTITELVSGGAAEETKDKGAGHAESKLAKFIKVFGLILLVMLGLAGAGFGGLYFVRKKRAAKVEAEPAEAETPKDKPKDK